MEDNKLVNLIEEIIESYRKMNKESGGYWNYLNNLSEKELKENISLYIILDSYWVKNFLGLENIGESNKLIKELDSKIYNKVKVFYSERIAEKSYILGYDDNSRQIDRVYAPFLKECMNDN